MSAESHLPPIGLAAGLPVRRGTRPHTGPVVPHEQLDQNGPPEVGEEL